MKTLLGTMLVFLTVIGIGFTAPNLSAQTDNRWVIGNGGVISGDIGNGMKMHATIGQFVAGMVESPSNKMYIGFWGPVTTKGTTDVNDNTPAVSGTSLISNFPNPFTMLTTINYTVPQGAPLTIRIVDMVGRDIRTLINNEYTDSGNHSIQWDAKDDAGSDVGAGNYVCEMSLTLNGQVLKARVPMMLVK